MQNKLHIQLYDVFKRAFHTVAHTVIIASNQKLCHRHDEALLKWNIAIHPQARGIIKIQNQIDGGKEDIPISYIMFKTKSEKYFEREY